MSIHICVLPGDGIGPEVCEQAVQTLKAVCSRFGHSLRLEEHAVGGAGLTESNDPLPAKTIEACHASQAILLGAVGGPQFDKYPRELRPEAGLLRLRTELGAFANLRPAKCFAGLENCSPLKPDVVTGADLLVVRELLGGLYFGSKSTEGEGRDRLAQDVMRYSVGEVERIARVAFTVAQGRKKRLLSVDKANVLECSRLWRDTVTAISQEYPDVELKHAYVDSTAMALVFEPTRFDVVLTENMFGDILSDEAGSIAGSLGMLASASIGGKVGLYEPVHGSAPDIAGKNVANPIGAILSTAMMLRHSLAMEEEANAIETAVKKALNNGLRTRDLSGSGGRQVSTSEMGVAIRQALADTTAS